MDSNTYLILRFVHIISAMVFFGLPFTFGRWYRAGLVGKDRQFMLESLQKMKTFLMVHMNLTGAIALGTGIFLAVQLNLFAPGGQKWVHAAPLLMILSLLNINLFLAKPMTNVIKALQAGGDTGEQEVALRKRIAAFSGIQHTLVTILTIFMVFKPF
ncbi:DUF2269 family protein [Acanthopleuribacter pedis]|uniref:DUF2269 family protein n=1 Tax=Acanthopleuribacter pedis TaxID=442870 RepID=A0A8J7Q7E8_9BACT|nr:DUF2269 family protein [Acanthopleuribacter pedis]MBO1319800.1 DUF2269 family protein [Acanthopleuribacter pedis]